VLLALFFVGSLTGGQMVGASATPGKAAPARQVSLASALGSLTPEQRARLKSQLMNAKVQMGTGYDEAATAWLRERIAQVIDRPEEYQLILEEWSERFAFLMLPISALLLGVLFMFQRRFYVFDHLVFSMHSLSFFGLLIAVYMIADKLVGDLAGWLMLVPPVHLFVHMRGVYATSVLGTLARMLLLFVGSLVGFVLLMIGLILVGMAALTPAAA